MPLTTAGKIRALQGLSGQAVSSTLSHVALFNGDPTGAGTEVSGGTYARQAITFNTVNSSNLDSSNTPTFTIPAGTTINFLAVFDAATGGNLLAYKAITSETFATEGSVVVNDLDINLEDA